MGWNLTAITESNANDFQSCVFQIAVEHAWFELDGLEIINISKSFPVRSIAVY